MRFNPRIFDILVYENYKKVVLEEATKKKKSNRYTTVAQIAKGDIEFDQEDFEKYVAETKNQRRLTHR